MLIRLIAARTIPTIRAHGLNFSSPMPVINAGQRNREQEDDQCRAGQRR